MSDYDYDLFVIGAGSGGVRAARLAALAGAKVAIAEEDRVGGTCVIRGCVPKKFLVYASEFSSAFETARGFGWSVEAPSFDWGRFRDAKDAEIARLSDIYISNLTKAGVELIRARATFEAPHVLRLGGTDGRTVTARRILIAVGGRPSTPSDVPGVELGVTSNDVFDLPELPKRILIVGGGYIAVEFAGVFHGLGSEVTLMHRAPRLLRGFDEEVRLHLEGELRKRGLNLMPGARHVSLEKTASGAILSRIDNGLDLETDVVMFATGRTPYVEGLGLDRVGVALNARGAVAVDAWSQTTAPDVYAVGDVTDRVNLTPVAIREAQAFAETLYYDTPTTFDHADIPTAVFSQPPIGTVGLTEAEARQRVEAVDVYSSRFRTMKTAFVKGDESTFMKLIVDAKTDRVLGCHIVGPDGPEIIQMAAVAVKAGLTKAQWDATCALHPTAAEELVTLRVKAPEPQRAAAQ